VGGERSAQVDLAELDPAELAVVAHPQGRPVAEVAYRALGPIDAAQGAGIDRRPVGHARRQARAGRLLRAGDPQPARQLAHLGLPELRLDERVDDAALRGGP